jgi:predicted deacetylase
MIRQWLLRREITRVTLLVIPAADLHPIGSRAPMLAGWLRGRVAWGDAVAQHGLVHRASAAPGWPRGLLLNWQGARAAEFPGLDREETARRVYVGHKLLNEIELDPRGFVAPAYAYTRALRGVLRGSFDWFADLHGIDRRAGGRLRARALCLGSSTALKCALSPTWVRAASRAPGPLMRIDIHPRDFDLPGHVAALDLLLKRASGRRIITYDELVA